MGGKTEDEPLDQNVDSVEPRPRIKQFRANFTQMGILFSL